MNSVLYKYVLLYCVLYVGSINGFYGRVHWMGSINGFNMWVL